MDYFPSMALQKSISTSWKENFLLLHVSSKTLYEDFTHEVKTMMLLKSAEQFDLVISVLKCMR